MVTPRSDLPVNTTQQTGLLSSIKSLNPFGQGGYVRLPTTEGPGAPLPARNRHRRDAWFRWVSPSVSPCFSTFHCPCVRHPHGPGAPLQHAAVVAGSCSYYCGVNRESDLHLDSEQMGPTLDLRWLQSRSTGLLRHLLCAMARSMAKPRKFAIL